MPNIWSVITANKTDDILVRLSRKDENDPEIGLALAELEFTIENESVHTALDFFERRTGRLYFNINSIKKLKQPILTAMESHFSWSESRKDNEINAVELAINKASTFN